MFSPISRRLSLAAATVLLGGAAFLRPVLAQKSVSVSDRSPVGMDAQGQVSLPQGQILTPAGKQISLPGLRPQALALSPDGHLLVTAGQTAELVVVHPGTGAILQRVPLPGEVKDPSQGPVSTHILKPDEDGQLSFTGLVFSPDGSRIYLSNVNGSIKMFGVEKGVVSGITSFPLPPSGLKTRTEEIPSGLAVSPDGKNLYVTGNLSNGLLELDAATGQVKRRFEVGFAPYDVALGNGRAYVTNWGGRRPVKNSVVGPAGRGTLVRVDGQRFIASEGSFSTIDLASGRILRETRVGRHACALTLSPDGRYLVVASAGDDVLSVFDTRDDHLVESIGVRVPGDLYGAAPDALAFSPSGQTLFVALAGRNAVASIAFKPGASQIRGLIPVGWFPGGLVYDAARRTVGVANIKGSGSGRGPKPTTHQYNGTLSLVTLPGAGQLAKYSQSVLEDARQDTINASKLPARKDAPPRVVPERVGEPSLIKHVIYIIKENRTYDQVLGDVKEGNGDLKGCIFGAEVTPNQHKLVHDFALLDNTYCSGVLSADGHEWADSGFATDYMERSFASFPRSYPDGMEDSDVDALAYSPAGFIWDNALKHGVTVRDYGEFAIGETGWADSARKGRPHFADFYADAIQGTAVTKIGSHPAIDSLKNVLCRDTIGWNLDVPDITRAARFSDELKAFERQGTMPGLTIICLPNDHTSGTRAGAPTPAAQVADNDLALGRIVQAISHSRFWKDSCIFAIEDDPQAGWDHVSAYRTTAYLASPYVKRGAVVSTQFNQPGLLHTMELMLGLPPMNAMDAAATPLTDCFTSAPDLRPFNAVSNRIPLDQMNPAPTALRDPVRRRYAKISATLPLQKPDQCPEDLLNHILWNARKGNASYPIRSAKDGAAKVKEDDDD